MHIGLVSGVLAGIWEIWQAPKDEWLRAFAIIITPANELVSEIHDRMPAILKPTDYVWRLRDAPEADDLMQSFDSKLMRMWPISTRVNSLHNDDAAILEPLKEAS